MSTFEASITAVAISFCLLCALLTRHLLTRLSLVFFVIYLLLEAFGFAVEWLLVHPDSPYKALWLGLLMASSFLMAPCLWLFAQETATNSRPRLSSVSAVEWGVVALGMLLTIPLLLAAHGGSLMVDPTCTSAGITSTIIHETMLLSIGLFLVQVLWYLRKCLRIIKTQTQNDMAHFSNIEAMPLNTLRVLVWVMLGNWVVSLLRTLRALMVDGFSHLDLLFTCAEVAITLWAMYTILKRAMLVAVNELKPVAEYELDDEALARENGELAQKYAKSALDDVVRQRIENKLTRAMSVDRLYERSNLKLRDLCDHLHENTHYVSQVINQTMGTTFYELVNQHRIEAAKTLLASQTRANVLEIALAVGFNSKTTFNAAFKRATGLTPREFKASATGLTSK